MPNANGDVCSGCERFWRVFDAVVQLADRNLGTRVLIVALAALGLCIGAIIAVAALK